jgi:hypothetical protein
MEQLLNASRVVEASLAKAHVTWSCCDVNAALFLISPRSPAVWHAQDLSGVICVDRGQKRFPCREAERRSTPIYAPYRQL